jgi:predicted DNA-binding protein (MmcQ/YjbR family)
VAKGQAKGKPSEPTETLRQFALAYPEAHEDHPWGETVIKVKGKVFVFLGRPGSGLSLSTKLPRTSAMALMLPFVEPTGYGLGKSGWVSATFGKSERPPLDLLRAWIDESYRAIAPRKLVALAPPLIAFKDTSRGRVGRRG